MITLYNSRYSSYQNYIQFLNNYSKINIANLAHNQGNMNDFSKKLLKYETNIKNKIEKSGKNVKKEQKIKPKKNENLEKTEKLGKLGKPEKPEKPEKKIVIPKNIYMTWGQKNNLPLELKIRILNMKRHNIDFKFYIYSDDDCLQFIYNNFGFDVFLAYNYLIPGAYKADLWRCCVLYKYGGIYMDIKFNIVEKFQLEELCYKEHFTFDRPPTSIYNAFLVCKPGNLLMKCTIQQIVQNVKRGYLGQGPLSPTGPELMGKIGRTLGIKPDIIHPNCGGYLLYKGEPILYTNFKEWKKVRDEYYNSKKEKTKRYNLYWEEKIIYNYKVDINKMVELCKKYNGKPLEIKY